MYSSVICLSLLGALGRVNVNKTLRFLLSCQNLDGGFGWYPKGESHAAAAFCCVGALGELDALHMVNLDALGMWLAERQTAGMWLLVYLHSHLVCQHIKEIGCILDYVNELCSDMSEYLGCNFVILCSLGYSSLTSWCNTIRLKG